MTLQGPLAAKRKKVISIIRLKSADDDAIEEVILDSIDAAIIPVLTEDRLIPGGLTITQPEYVAYIDDMTEIRTGDIIRMQGRKDLYVTGSFEGEESQRLDLMQGQG